MNETSKPNPRTWPLYPFLLASFPVLSLYARNVERMPFRDAVRSWGITIVVVIALGAALALLTRSTHKAALIVSLWLLAFFFYPLYALPRSMAEDAVVVDAHLLVTAGILATISVFLARSAANFAALTRIATVITVIAVALPLVSIASQSLRRPEVAQLPTPSETVHYGEIQGETWAEITPEYARSHTPKPDVYYIIVDAYARADVLEEYYDYDNRPFLNDLRDRGFFVADRARANYNQTLMTLTANLNLAYLDWAFDDPEESKQLFARLTRTRPTIAFALANNQVMAFLKQFGYTTVAFSTGVSQTEFRHADIFFETADAFNEFESVLFGGTPLPHLIERLTGAQPEIVLYRNRVLHTFRELRGLDDRYSPKFVFAHFISPHPPFVFRRDGSLNTSKTNTWNTGYKGVFAIGHTVSREEYQEGYRDQVHYLNIELLKTIDSIRDTNPDAIIVLQSDHGPGSMTDWNDPANTNVHERLAILTAYYFPDGDYDALNNGMTPVNTFRIIFNKYFGTDMPILENKSYMATLGTLENIELVSPDRIAPH